MSVQAPAFTGVSRPGLGVAPGIATWLRGIGVRQVRLTCGLVMFSYIFSHFFNHALGNVSYALMEKWLTLHIWWWRIPIVNATLYAAAAIHFRSACGRCTSAAIFASPSPKSPSCSWV
jgi:adenylate cyclase